MGRCRYRSSRRSGDCSASVEPTAVQRLSAAVTTRHDDGGKLIRIVSYNVHSCIGYDGRFDPERIVEVLSSLDADFIALQEVEEQDYAGVTVSAFLADALDLCIAGSTTPERGGIPYGNILLSRIEPSNAASHDLAFAKRERRGAIESNFEVYGLHLRLVATHFGLAMRERHDQVRRILPRLQDHTPDITVCCADFNEWIPFSRVHRALAGALGPATAIRTFPARLPVLALDRIYASPRDCVNSVYAVDTVPARRASDHLPVVCELQTSSSRDRPASGSHRKRL